ncbi:12567_t:CDS:2, partial [Entrophospora sp. SA101]
VIQNSRYNISIEESRSFIKRAWDKVESVFTQRQETTILPTHLTHFQEIDDEDDEFIHSNPFHQHNRELIYRGSLLKRRLSQHSQELISAIPEEDPSPSIDWNSMNSLQQYFFIIMNQIETYISTRKTLKRLYVLLDARHGIKIADIEFLKMLDEKNVTFQIILTKCDLVIPPDLARRHFLVQETLRNNYTNSIDPPLMVSSVRKKSGIIKLRKELLLVIGALDKAREVMRRKNTSLKLNKAKDKNNNNNYNNSFVKSNNAKKFNRRTKKTR